MSLNGFSHRIELHTRPSKRLAAYLLLLYGVVCLALFISSMAIGVKLLCCVWLLWFARTDWESTQQQIDLAFIPPNQWRLRLSGGRWLRATPRSHFATWSWLTLLRFSLPGRRIRTVILVAGNCQPVACRRLRAWLRWGHLRSEN